MVSNKTQISIYEYGAELPEWSVGDFWEYNYSISIARVVVFEATRMDVLVINDDGAEYTVKMSGYLDKLIFGSYDYSGLIKAAYMDGIAHIDKSTLSTKNYSITVTANMHSPIDLEIKINLNMEFDPQLDSFNFPIEVGNQWNLNSDVDFYITGYIRESGVDAFTIDEESLDNPLVDGLSVLKNEVLSVKAGSFDSYLISGGLGNPSKIWYSPEVGYLVKVDQFIPKFLKIYIKVNFGSYLELLSTNFNYPENNAPDTPTITGPSIGTIKKEYECIVKTTDPNGEQVYYMVDWGDGTLCNWIGPFNSSEEVAVNHTYLNQAEFQIRVRAKDTNGYQTAWAEPMSVTMPKNSVINTLFYKFLKAIQTFFLQ